MNANGAQQRQIPTHFEHRGNNMVAVSQPAGGARPAAKRRRSAARCLLGVFSFALLSGCTLTHSLDEYSSGDPGASPANKGTGKGAEDGGATGPDATAGDGGLDLNCMAPSDCPGELPVCCGISVTAQCAAQPIGCDYVLCKTSGDCAPGKGCYPVNQYIPGGGICV